MGEASGSLLENYSQDLGSLLSVLSRAGIYISGERSFLTPTGRRVIDLLISRPCDDKLFEEVYRLLSRRGYIVFQYMSRDGPVLRITRFDRKRDLVKRLCLLITTFITVWLTGFELSRNYIGLMELAGYTADNPFFWATIYTLSFLGALAVHEYGHIAVSKRFSVPISGPYFIPAPPAQLGFIGTLGSVIMMKNMPPTKRSLILLGLSGPLAGFMAALVVTIIGINMSTTIPSDLAARLVEEQKLSAFPYMPLIMMLLLMLRNVPPDQVIVLHPLAFAGFIIFVVTFLNLMPIGQLDGGHVVRAFTSANKHKKLGLYVIGALALLGIVLFNAGGYIYLFIAAVLLILRTLFGSKIHPGPANMLSKTTSVDRLFLVVYVLLVVLTAPLPTSGW